MKERFKLKELLTGYIFLLPQLALILILVVIPLIFSLVVSFCDWDLVSGLKGIKFVGLENYISMWNEKKFVVSFFNTLYYAVGVVPTSLILALIFAIILNKHVYSKGLLRMVFFMPYVSNIVAISVVWLYILHPDEGIVNNILRTIGLSNPPGWFGSTSWALPGLMIISVWQATGYCMIIYMAGLQGIPAELYEAVKIDGASMFEQFRYITLPMLSPTTFFLVITRVIQTFQIFAPISVITRGGPGYSSNVLVYYLYNEAFSNYKMGYASAVSWILFTMIFIITLVQWRGQKKWVNY